MLEYFAGMPVLFIDFETPMSATANLKRLTLRQYLAWCKDNGGILGVAWAVDDGPITWEAGHPPSDLLDDFQQVANDSTWIIVAHNAAFDIRVWTQILGLPWPNRIRCTLELAHAAWPNMPGAPVYTATGERDGDRREPAAYSLKSLATTLSLGLPKLAMPPVGASDADWNEYCTRDVELCRRVYNRAVPRISPMELATAERTNAIREAWLEIDHGAVIRAIEGFTTVTAGARTDAAAVLGAAAADEAFGLDVDGTMRSVKPAQVKRLLLDHLGFDTPTISAKKLNPMKVADNPEAARVLEATSIANKALSHRRRVGVFATGSQIDVELGYFRAHTGRFSSPSVGKGLNLHNIPKHNKVLAKAIRQMFRWPEGYCMVQGDEANVEYRIAGWLSGCRHITELFTMNPLADPYSEYWFTVTGQRVTKLDPARQVAKAAVLGLTFLMGLQTWMAVLLKALADEATYHLTIHDFDIIAHEQRWELNRYARQAQAKTHAPDGLARVALGTWEAFHRIHPEIRLFAQWLEQSVDQASRALAPQGALDWMTTIDKAPDPDKIRLVWEDSPDLERSIRVYLGGWDHPTVTWRDIGIRPVGFEGGMCMSSRQVGSKGYRALTKNILIENVVQSCARVGLVKGQRILESAHPLQMSVHDAAMLIVRQDRESILRARADLLAVFGPGNSLGFDWAVLMNPAEINVSKTLYEVEQGADWWARLKAGDESLLTSLP
jgi:hypothetical protein